MTREKEIILLKDLIDCFKKIENTLTIDGDTLIIESAEIYNELMNRKFEANYNRVYFIKKN